MIQVKMDIIIIIININGGLAEVPTSREDSLILFLSSNESTIWVSYLVNISGPRPSLRDFSNS